MADQVPIKGIFNGSGDPTGLAEFTTSDTIGYADGGTGLNTLGTAGQVLKVNSGATSLEWGSIVATIDIDNATDLTSSTLISSDQILISDGGTEGRVTLSQLDTLFSGTTQTLTNKTLTSPTITGTGAIAGIFTGNITGDVTGNADTATTLETARTIAGQSFDGSANITIASTDLSNTSDVVLLTSTQTLTNKTLTSPVISTISNTGTLTLPTSTGTVALVSDIPTNNNQLTNGAGYLTSFTETNDLTASVTWANVPDANITESSVTQHEAALSIGNSQLTSGIDAAKISSGSVSNTEFDYLDGVTSNIQTQLDDKVSKGFAIAMAIAL